MGSVKFGFTHLNKPTPAGITRSVRVITVILGIFLAWMNTDNLIPETAQHVINSLGGLILGIINGVAPLFSIDIASTATVPAGQVTSMETPKPVTP